MSRRRKQTYLAILLTCGAALVVDQFFRGSTPQSAAAKARSLEALGVESPMQDASSVAAAPYPRNLPDFQPTDLLRDPFLRIDAAIVRPDRPNQTTATQFQERHRLSGIMQGGGVAFAVIDKQWLRVGDQMDQCDLMEISGTHVTFKCFDEIATLSVIKNNALTSAPK